MASVNFQFNPGDITWSIIDSGGRPTVVKGTVIETEISIVLENSVAVPTINYQVSLTTAVFPLASVMTISSDKIFPDVDAALAALKTTITA